MNKKLEVNNDRKTSIIEKKESLAFNDKSNKFYYHYKEIASKEIPKNNKLSSEVKVSKIFFMNKRWL